MLGTRAGPQRRHVAWVGTSMGGLMGIMFAARRHSPIRRLVLNDVGPLVPWPALVQMKQAHSGLHATFASSEEAEAHLRKVCASFGPITDAQWRQVARHSTLRKGSGYILAFDPAIITHMHADRAYDPTPSLFSNCSSSFGCYGRAVSLIPFMN
jgi:pimeloyl-ACP methyl ester carboxylesterase